MYSDICEGVSIFGIYWPVDAHLLTTPRSSLFPTVTIADEVEEWLLENVGDEFKIVDNMNQIEVWIYDLSKATMFKMRWG